MGRRLLAAVDARLGAQVGDGLAGDAGRREVCGDGWDDAGGAQAAGAACGSEGAGQGPQDRGGGHCVVGGAAETLLVDGCAGSCRMMLRMIFGSGRGRWRRVLIGVWVA